MNEHTSEEKFLKVIESFGELLLNKDKTIKFNEFEIKALKKKIERMEQYIEYYSQPTEEITEVDYKETSKQMLKQSV